MELMSEEIEGKYFGTEINEKWWRRYTKNKMLARGNGLFSYNEQSLSFLRRLTKVPISIPFAAIQEFKTGRWHAGQWGAGQSIIKVIWKQGGLLLSSGFTVSKDKSTADRVLAELNAILAAQDQSS